MEGPMRADDTSTHLNDQQAKRCHLSDDHELSLGEGTIGVNKGCRWTAACLVVLLLAAGHACAEMPVPQPGGESAEVKAQPPPGLTAYYCTSRLAGYFPKIGPFYHASVAICPQGQSPVIYQDGEWVSNPVCVFYGTHPEGYGFIVDDERRGVTWSPAEVPPEIVMERLSTYHQPWSLLRNNCKHSAQWATGR
jgi:hypothetical protein